MASESSEVSVWWRDKRWVEYAVKAAVLLVAFALIAWLAPSMPPLGLAVIWGVLSIASAIGVAYHYVINKVRNRAGLEDGGVIARFNAGRVISLLIAFAVSALCIGGFILELPKWEVAEWIMLVLAIPLYVGIFHLLKKLLKKEYKPMLWASRMVMLSSVFLCAVLLIAYVVICLAGPTVYYDSMTAAFLGAKQPFENSPSVLLADAGYIGALVDGLTAFAMSRLAENAPAGYIALRVVICFSTAVGISNLIGACSLRLDELKLVFQPLSAADDPEAKTPLLKRYVVWACVLPVLLIAGSAYADAKANEVVQTEGYTMVRNAIRDQVGMAACVIDGKKYDYEKVQELVERAQHLSDDLAAEREAALTPLINEAFDRRLENVDAYLDWYYSLPADYDRLLQYFAGTIEDGMKQQLAERINEGVDETALDEALNYYMGKSEELKSSITDELARYELSDYGYDDVPEWLIVPVKVLDTNFLSEPLEPTQKFLDTGARIGLSAGTGIVAGVIAARATEKILAKPFFRKIVASLVEKLGTRGLIAVGGTALAPGVGTAVGIGIGFVGDYLFLKADEVMNRESYREEIVSAIEEGRAEMLDMVRA